MALTVTMGCAVKALGDGKVSGYLVQWGSEATKDGDGEWFTPHTDFDVDFPARASVYYHHGLDPAIGRQRLTHGTMSRDARGVRIDATLDLRQPAQKGIYGKVQRGELGWSSGSLSHITIPPRNNPGGPIRQWPLGHDASLTWIPSDRRNLAIATKSAPLPLLERPAFKSPYPTPTAEALLSAPLMLEADSLASIAEHEAAHACLAWELGARINHVSALMRVTCYDALPESPLERAAIALAGGRSQFGWKMDRALAAGNVLEVLGMVSETDWKAVEDALGALNSDTLRPSHPTLQTLEAAAALAAGYLATHSRRLQTLKDGLLRHAQLNGAEVDALVEYADFSPRDVLAEPAPRLLNFAGV